MHVYIDHTWPISLLIDHFFPRIVSAQLVSVSVSIRHIEGLENCFT